MRAIIENMISPDYVLCYIPRVLDISLKKFKDLDFENLGNFSIISEIFGKLRVISFKVGGKL